MSASQNKVTGTVRIWGLVELWRAKTLYRDRRNYWIPVVHPTFRAHTEMTTIWLKRWKTVISKSWKKYLPSANPGFQTQLSFSSYGALAKSYSLSLILLFPYLLKCRHVITPFIHLEMLWWSNGVRDAESTLENKAEYRQGTVNQVVIALLGAQSLEHHLGFINLASSYSLPSQLPHQPHGSFMLGQNRGLFANYLGAQTHQCVSRDSILGQCRDSAN